MHAEKFIDLSRAQQKERVHNRFQFREGVGWFTPEGIFVGRSAEDVIAALIDLRRRKSTPSVTV
jgi:hypothetical protein